MASQYITFMVIFILGLSLVIITNGMFLNFSESFRENIADLEMTRLLDQIKEQIHRNLFLHTDSQQRITQQIELPIQLGQRYQYTIDISNSSDGNSIALHGYTQNNKINQITTLILGENYSIRAEGEFNSINSLFTILIEKSANLIILTIS